MKIFKVHEGTPVRVCRVTTMVDHYEEKTTTKELTFELEDVKVDPFHPEALGIKTIGHEYAKAGWYGFDLKDCGQFKTLYVPMDKVGIWG